MSVILTGHLILKHMLTFAIMSSEICISWDKKLFAPIVMTIFITFCRKLNFVYRENSEVNIFVPDLYFTIQNQILLDIVSRSKNWLKFGYTVYLCTFILVLLLNQQKGFIIIIIIIIL